MRYMTLWRPGAGSNANSEQMFREMEALIVEMRQKGVLIETGGWDPSSPSIVLTNTGSTITVTDGPFTESKELIAGFAIVEVASHEEALEWGRRFLRIAGKGTSELRVLG